MTDLPEGIRSANLGDVSRLVNLYQRAYKKNERIGFPSRMVSVEKATVKNWIQNRFVFVASYRGELVGAVHIIPREDWEVPEVGRLAVFPKFQNHGIGENLLEFAENYLKSNGWEKAKLRTLIDHPFLEDWYQERGYTKTAVEELDNYPYDIVVLEKKFIE